MQPLLFTGIMELEFQGRYEKGLFVFGGKGQAAKKRYALIGKEGNLTVRGFQTIRKDWCDEAKRLQRKVLLLVLRGKEEAVAG